MMAFGASRRQRRGPGGRIKEKADSTENCYRFVVETENISRFERSKRVIITSEGSEGNSSDSLAGRVVEM